jgi:membrane protein
MLGPIDRLNTTVERIKTRPRVALVVTIWERQERDGVGHLAAAVTYYLFLSVLPALMLALSIAGYFLSRRGLDEIQRTVERIATELPGIGPLVSDSLPSISRSWTGMSAVAILFIVWAGTGGIAAVRDAMARIFHTTTGGNIAAKRGQSLAIIFAFGPLLLASVGATTWATNLGDNWSPLARWTATILAIVFAIAFNFVIFIALYRMFVPGSGAAAHNHWPGAMVSAVAFTALTLIGSTYTQRVVTRATLVWGAFAGVIGALIILNLAVRFFLYGAELTAFRLEHRARG